MSDMTLASHLSHAQAVSPAHIFNLCLGRGMLPALVLDVRSTEDFAASHLVGSFSCPVESQV